MGSVAPLVLQAILAAISAAPQIEQIVIDAKNWIDSLVKGGVIAAGLQDALKAYVDGHAVLVKAGIKPPNIAWTVEANP